MTVIFDFDGTIHNTKHLYGCAFRKAYAMLVKEGYAPPRTYTDEDVSGYLGVSVPVMWQSFMPDLPQDIRHKASMMIGQEMIDGVERGEAVVYEGIFEALALLRQSGCRLLILSNCREAYMNAHRKALGLDNYFDGYFCAESFGFIPKEQIFPLLAERFPDTRYIMTGDRASDLQVGLTNHIPTIGCLYGFAEPDELSEADILVHTPQEIPEQIFRITADQV